MNVILMRAAQDHVNLLGEPFATSTPLKIEPSNGKIGNLLHRQLLACDSDNLTRKPPKRLSASSILQSKLTESKSFVPKKVKRNKSSAYFDLSSSSSDEDSGETKKRPIIRVSSKNTRSLLSARTVESDEVVNKVSDGAFQPVDSSKTVKNTKNRNNSDPKSKNGRGVNGRSRAKSKNTHTGFENVSESSDEECKIFDESNTNKNTVSSAKPSLETDENVIKSKKLGDGNEGEKTKMPKILLKGTNKGDNQSQTQKRLPKAASNNDKLSKLLKRKGISVTTNGGPKKKSSKKDKSPGEVGNPITPLKLWGNKSNLSHQLFSDSREQEFINTLDLTCDEVNDSARNITCSLWQKTKTTPSKQITSTNHNKDVGDETKLERPVRRKQKPKEYWMPENTSPTTSTGGDVNQRTYPKTNTKPFKCQTVTQQMKGDKLVEEVKENHKSKKLKGNVGPKGVKKLRTKGNILKEKKLNAPDDDDEAVVTSTNQNKLQKTKTNGEVKLSRLHVDDKLEKVVEDRNLEEKVVITGETVFQLLSELTFKENDVGCSVVQCQSINNFKCGVLKLKVQSEFQCRTLHSNSHLGGVVVRGLIRMKIGEKELELKEGDMAFVPPLTEWQATNIGTSESVFYYWCGRFK